MRLSSSLLTAAALILVIAPAAHADTMTLSVSSSVLASYGSPNDNFWGYYSTVGSPTSSSASVRGGVEADFSNISLTVPTGSIINFAIITYLFPPTPDLGTGFLFVEQSLAPPDPDNPVSTAPTFSGNGTSSVIVFSVDAPYIAKVNGDEVSTGDLTLMMDLVGGINDSVETPGYNWSGYIGGDGQADIPYTVQLTVDYTAPPVPEPSSIVLLGTGLLGLAGIARRKFLSQS